MNKQIATEDMHLEKEWFEQAGRQTMDTLPEFMNHVMNDYCHDYGTVCHAIAACALAAACAANEMDGACGGITGFQAGFVMWDFIKQWQYPNAKTGMKIVNFDDMLYPQYDFKFQKTIGRKTWDALQREAEKNLSERGYAADAVLDHWKSIVSGKVPFGYVVKDE